MYVLSALVLTVLLFAAARLSGCGSGRTELPDDTLPSASVEPAQRREETAVDQQLLKNTLQGLSDGFRGSCSIGYTDLRTGERILIGDKPMVAASLIKLYVAEAYYAAVHDGVIADSEREQVRLMLSESDNAACNAVIELLGMEKINAYIAQHYPFTQLNRRMLEQNGLENYTSAADCCALLERLWNSNFVSAEASAQTLEALKAQIRREKIPAVLPDEIVCANKTGELDGVENDAAIVMLPDDRAYALCVMVQTDIGNGNAMEFIRSVSAATYTIVTN